MNEQEKQAAVERYLKELEDELGEVPVSRRRELLEMCEATSRKRGPSPRTGVTRPC